MKGPAGRPAAIAARAWSYILVTTALTFGLRASMRSMTVSSSSVALISRRLTSSASPHPSYFSNSGKCFIASRSVLLLRWGEYTGWRIDVSRNLEGMNRDPVWQAGQTANPRPIPYLDFGKKGKKRNPEDGWRGKAVFNFPFGPIKRGNVRAIAPCSDCPHVSMKIF